MCFRSCFRPDMDPELQDVHNMSSHVTTTSSRMWDVITPQILNEYRVSITASSSTPSSLNPSVRSGSVYYSQRLCPSTIATKQKQAVSMPSVVHTISRPSSCTHKTHHNLAHIPHYLPRSSLTNVQFNPSLDISEE